VIQPDSGEAKNTTALAISSGSPMRPIIAFAAKRSSPLPIACAAAALRHIGSDEGGRHRVHSDVVRAKLHGKAFGQNRNLGLGRRIERVAREGGADPGGRAYRMAWSSDLATLTILP
jgi:hypothetical protein